MGRKGFRETLDDLNVKARQGLVVMEQLIRSPEFLKMMVKHHPGYLHPLLKCLLSDEEQKELTGACSIKGRLDNQYVKKICGESEVEDEGEKHGKHESR